MEKADVVENCNRLSHELENAQSAVKSDQEEIRLVEQEVTRLENAKIALRIEFGNLTDKARILERDNALQQIQLSINSRKNELANLRFSREKDEEKLRNLQSAFNSFGCSSIRNI